MKTSNIKLIALATCSTLLFAMPVTAAAPKKVTIDHQNLLKLAPADQQRVLCIADRLDEITAMDRSSMERVDRKALRSELRALKNEADAYNRDGGGTVIYFSSAAIIIIIILLIILL